MAYTPLGVMVALLFIGLPFVVRPLQPALEDLDAELEEAAASLGAGRLQTFRRVFLPSAAAGPAFGLCPGPGPRTGGVRLGGFHRRAIAIWKPRSPPCSSFRNWTSTIRRGATAIGVVMLGASFLLLLFINVVQWWSRRQHA